MESSTVLLKSALPNTGSPYYHKSLNNDITKINTVLLNSNLSDDDKRVLLDSFANLAKVCVADAVERISV